MFKPSTKDNIIKNPARNNREDEDLDFYTPAYVRHKITPIKQEFSALDGKLVDEEVDYDSQAIINDIVKDPTANKTPEVGEFILMVQGKVISHGNHENILTEIKSILYGENDKFINKNIKVDDIVLLKRIGLKVGIFLDE